MKEIQEILKRGQEVKKQRVNGDATDGESCIRYERLLSQLEAELKKWGAEKEKCCCPNGSICGFFHIGSEDCLYGKI